MIGLIYLLTRHQAGSAPKWLASATTPRHSTGRPSELHLLN